MGKLGGGERHPLANHESFSNPSLLQDGPLHVPADPPQKCVSALEQRHLQLKVTAGFSLQSEFNLQLVFFSLLSSASRAVRPVGDEVDIRWRQCADYFCLIVVKILLERLKYLWLISLV